MISNLFHSGHRGCCALVLSCTQQADLFTYRNVQYMTSAERGAGELAKRSKPIDLLLIERSMIWFFVTTTRAALTWVTSHSRWFAASSHALLLQVTPLQTRIQNFGKLGFSCVSASLNWKPTSNDRARCRDYVIFFIKIIIFQVVTGVILGTYVCCRILTRKNRKTKTVRSWKAILWTIRLKLGLQFDLLKGNKPPSVTGL